MKKLRIISEKIENSNSSYFGRGSFETVVKNNSDIILSWLENLTSIQNQIRILNDEYECENLQKRNYVRIITKLFPQEYNQFVCLNILLRDIESITLAYLDDNDLKKQYELLIINNRLKFPGKHKKTVDFDTYQQFITLYANDLIDKSQDFETEEILSIKRTYENEDLDTDILLTTETFEDKTNILEENISEEISEVKDAMENNNTKDKTNWMNVLLKGI